MALIALSDEDLEEVHSLFSQFHQGYASFFHIHTKSVAKSSKAYLQGQLLSKHPMNLFQFCREVPDSEYEARQHFLSSSPWHDVKLLRQLQKDVCHLIGDDDDGALILDESGIPKQGKLSVGVERQYCGRLGKVENCQVGVYLA